jgi:hypothetical protein
MRTFIFVALIAIFPLTLLSQKIKVDEVDKFTKLRVIETTFEKVSSDNSPLGTTGGRMMKNVWAGIKQVNGTNYLRLKWCSNKVFAMGEGAHVIFLDRQGETYKYENAEYTLSGIGEGTVGYVGSLIYGLDIYLLGDVTQLLQKEIDAFRIYTTDGYVDFDVTKKGNGVFSKLVELITETGK